MTNEFTPWEEQQRRKRMEAEAATKFAAEQARATQLEQWRQENAAAKAARLARIEADKQALRDADYAQQEVELAPQRETERRAWLAAHPGHSNEEFAKQAWPAIRENLIAQAKAAKLDALIAKARSSGDYQP